MLIGLYGHDQIADCMATANSLLGETSVKVCVLSIINTDCCAICNCRCQKSQVCISSSSYLPVTMDIKLCFLVISLLAVHLDTSQCSHDQCNVTLLEELLETDSTCVDAFEDIISSISEGERISLEDKLDSLGCDSQCGTRFYNASAQACSDIVDESLQNVCAMNAFRLNAAASYFIAVMASCGFILTV